MFLSLIYCGVFYRLPIEVCLSPTCCDVWHVSLKIGFFMGFRDGGSDDKVSISISIVEA